MDTYQENPFSHPSEVWALSPLKNCFSNRLSFKFLMYSWLHTLIQSIVPVIALSIPTETTCHYNFSIIVIVMPFSFTIECWMLFLWFSSVAFIAASWAIRNDSLYSNSHRGTYISLWNSLLALQILRRRLHTLMQSYKMDDCLPVTDYCRFFNGYDELLRPQFKTKCLSRIY